MTPSVAEQKRAVRALMKERLAEIDAAAARAAGAAAAARLLALPAVRRARGMVTFLSFRGEIDTTPLIERWTAEGRSLFVPRMRRREEPIEVCRYPCELELSVLGMRQPIDDVPAVSTEELERELDLAVVPGLAFDAEGGRLGWGAGAFDRFLSLHRDRRLVAVGLGHDFQVVARVPVEPHDVPLAGVVTDARVARDPR